MQPHREGAPRASERLRGLLGVEFIPGDEQQQLTVISAQLAESACQRTVGNTVELPCTGRIPTWLNRCLSAIRRRPARR